MILVLGNFGTEAILSSVKSLSATALLFLFVALFLSAVTASLRLQILAKEMGYQVNFRQAMLTVGAGSLGGAIFFQLAGQLIARSAILGRYNISPASVVFLTGYERAVSAIVAASLAIAGAYILFSGIVITKPADGFLLLKIIIGLSFATLAGAIIGFPSLAHRLVALSYRRILVTVGIRRQRLELAI